MIVTSMLLLVIAQQPWVRHTVDKSLKGADGVRLADFNGDGLLDIHDKKSQEGRRRCPVTLCKRRPGESGCGWVENAVEPLTAGFLRCAEPDIHLQSRA
jgi:hypothetical protein